MHKPEETLMGPQKVTRETWLTRKPHSSALIVALASTFVLILGAVLYWRDVGHLSRWMSANPGQVFTDHEWWRAWSTLFVHSDEKHLLSNSFLFFILAFFLSAYFGYVVFPLAAFVCGGFINFAVLKNMPLNTDLIGMSGVVYWMGGAWLILYFMIERRKSIFQRALRSIGVALALFMPAEAFNPQISYQSHLIGFLCGVLFGIFYYFYKRPDFLAAEVVETLVEEVDTANDADGLSVN